MIRQDLIGKVFGKWSVIGDPKSGTNNATFWLCRCECGVQRRVLANSLVSGRSHSCGTCGTRNGRIKERNPNWKGFGDIRLSKWNSFIESAKRRNIPFRITIQDGWRQFLKQNGRCALTNLPLVFYPTTSRNASLDRIKSDKPYTKNNIQWVHKDVNRMKGDLAEEKFIAYCTMIAHNTST
jgi:hypothetical protein